MANDGWETVEEAPEDGWETVETAGESQADLLKKAMGAKTYLEQAEEVAKQPGEPQAQSTPDQETRLVAGLAGTARGAVIPELVGKVGAVAAKDIKTLVETGKPATTEQKQEAFSQFSKGITEAQQKDPALGTAGEVVGAFAQPTIGGVGKGLVKGVTSAVGNVAGVTASQAGRAAVSEDPNQLTDIEKNAAIAAGLEGFLRLPAPAVRQLLAKVGKSATPAAERAAVEAVTTGTQKGRANIEKYHPEAGRTLLDEGVVSFGASKKGMQGAAKESADRANVQLNAYVNAADAQGPIQSSQVIDALKVRADKYGSNAATVDKAKVINDLIDKINNVHGDTMSVADLRLMKGQIQNKAHEGFSQAESKALGKEIGGILGEVQDSIVTKRLGDKAGQDYLKAQQQVGDIVTAKKTLEKGKDSQLGLKEIIAGGLVGTVNPAAGIVAPFATKELISRYPASKAAILNWIGKQSTDKARLIEQMAKQPGVLETILPRLEKEIGISPGEGQQEAPQTTDKTPEGIGAVSGSYFDSAGPAGDGSEPPALASGGLPSQPVPQISPTQPEPDTGRSVSEILQKLNPFGASTAMAAEPQPVPAPTPDTRERLTPSAEPLPVAQPAQQPKKKQPGAVDTAVKMIADFEQFTPTAKPEPTRPGKAPKHYYGYGESGYHISEGDEISEPEARALLKNKVAKIVTSLDKDENLDYLTPTQKATVASLVYNIGNKKFKSSQAYKKLASGDVEGALSEWAEFRKTAGKPEAGLEKRRMSEIHTFREELPTSQDPKQFKVPKTAKYRAVMSSGGDADYQIKEDGVWRKMKMSEVNDHIGDPEFGDIVHKMDAHRKSGKGVGVIYGVSE